MRVVYVPCSVQSAPRSITQGAPTAPCSKGENAKEGGVAAVALDDGMYAGLIAAGVRQELVEVAHTTTLHDTATHRKYTKETWVRKPVPPPDDG